MSEAICSCCAKILCCKECGHLVTRHRPENGEVVEAIAWAREEIDDLVVREGENCNSIQYLETLIKAAQSPAAAEGRVLTREELIDLVRLAIQNSTSRPSVKDGAPIGFAIDAIDALIRAGVVKV